jgi:FKBP-type peptidyl-prolyl cis-trans isomerase
VAKTHERVFALVGALLFFGTTAAVSIVVVLQVRQQNQAEKSSQDSSSTTDAANQLKAQDAQPQEGQLQGTQLADFTPVAKIDSLQKIDTQVGTGDTVKPGDTVTAHYTGAVAATGIIFQSSHDTGQPVAFPLDSVIKGWTDGVPGMKVGGKRRLLIPADQAYGATPPQGSGIPANADLVFDIELVKIGQ